VDKEACMSDTERVRAWRQRLKEGGLVPMTITTGQKVGQNHRFENGPRRQVGALVPCCRWKNDKKMGVGAMMGMN